MKQKLFVLMVILFIYLISFVSQASADSIKLGETDMVTGNQQKNEINWLTSGLGYTITESSSIIAYDQNEWSGGEDQDVTHLSWDPGFEWIYAVIKWDGMYSAYQYDPSDTPWLLIANLDQGVSGITFVSPVPIPPAVLLLGSGLIGLVGWKRRFNKI